MFVEVMKDTYQRVTCLVLNAKEDLGEESYVVANAWYRKKVEKVSDTAYLEFWSFTMLSDHYMEHNYQKIWSKLSSESSP